jgi:alkanesulfonate monooxygenase SsuD/methylene tetrahydromethanopterin reductase-like flavin-dependent oxidoreductase (luciferase family)
MPRAGSDGPALGVRIPQYGASWPEIRDTALRIEELGFDGVWVNDHLQSPGRVKRDPTFDALTTLSAIAALTRRVRLGTMVLSASYRPAPLAAKMATILDVISGGRLVLGLGTGSNVPEHRAYGVPFLPRAERTEMLRAALETMRAMFDGADDAPPNVPPPVQPGGPPIWLAAHRPRLLRLAGERADGIVAAFVGPAEAARRLGIARAARPEALPPLSCALYAFVMPVPSRREAQAWVAAEADNLGTTPAAFLRWMSSTGMVAPPDELRATLAEHRAAGVTDAILVLPSRVPPETLDALAEATL